MTSTTVTTAVPAAPPFREGVLARAIATFSGTVGASIRIALLALSNALAAWAVYVLLDRKHWVSLACVALATAGIDAVYLAKRRWSMPAKFLIPGTIFLVAFQVIPIVYTVTVAFTNYSTGHILGKSSAIAAIKENSLEPPASGNQYEMSPARDASGKLVLLLHNDATGAVYAGSKSGLTQLPKADVTIGATGQPTAAKGYTLITGATLFSLGSELEQLEVPTEGGAAIQPQGVSQAVELQPTLRYDAKRDVFVRVRDGLVFADNGRGSFAAVGNPSNELEPGWKTGVGFRNFREIVADPLVRTPFLSVFAFTLVFATSVVLISFAIGLFLAIALNRPGMRLQRFYRSALIIPYAVPGFLSLFVWGGLLNDDFGVVNQLFHIHVPWLFGNTMARVSVIMVSVWLTVPYFFLVCLGALQSIPQELTEAAHVDGGGAWQIFRRVTLPLLLVAVAPLMIASFALNFNNFNNIYLLTGGGPYNGTSSIAGSTDILISYTYKLAIATGKGQDFGLASAVSIIIFFIVAGISGVSFWRSKSLESLR